MRYWQQWHSLKDGEEIQSGSEGSNNENQQEGQGSVLGDSSSVESVPDLDPVITEIQEVKVTNYAACLLLSVILAYMIVRDLLGGRR